MSNITPAPEIVDGVPRCSWSCPAFQGSPKWPGYDQCKIDNANTLPRQRVCEPAIRRQTAQLAAYRELREPMATAIGGYCAFNCATGHMSDCDEMRAALAKVEEVDPR